MIIPFAIFAAVASFVSGATPVENGEVAPLNLQANAPLNIRNGHIGEAKSANDGNQTRVVVDMTVDAGWFKFFFGQADDPTAYVFRFNSNDYVQVSITDAYCPGDAWDLNKDHKYLLTTPRVPTDGCTHWTDNPDVAFYNPIWSSTKFMLPGNFNMTLWTKDSPYQGGAAFIRADSHIVNCSKAVGPFKLITNPKVPHEQVANVCARIGGVPAHVTPNNALAASQTLTNCLGPNAHSWFGKLSLVQMTLLKALRENDLGCLALSNAIPEDPTVEVVDCNTLLPTLCLANSSA